MYKVCRINSMNPKILTLATSLKYIFMTPDWIVLTVVICWTVWLCSIYTLLQSQEVMIWKLSFSWETSRGRDLGETGGRSPPKIWGGGTAHASVPPNILRSSVVGCAGKYEKSIKGCFSCEERVIYDIKHSKDTENLVKERENPKNLVDD